MPVFHIYIFSILLLNPFQRPFQIWYFPVPGSQFHSRELGQPRIGRSPNRDSTGLHFGFFISVAPAVSALLSTASTFTVPQSPFCIQLVGTFVSGDLLILTLIVSLSGGKSSKECIRRFPDMDCAGS